MPPKEKRDDITIYCQHPQTGEYLPVAPLDLELELSTAANVFDVAKYILNRQGKMSTLKLQKLCYYSQAWSLAWTDEPLFKEHIEAWQTGPVCRELYHKIGDKLILSASDLNDGNPDNLDEDQQDTIDRVLDYYGDWLPTN